MAAPNQRILVTGGGTFLGDNIAAALLAEGAEVTLLVRPGAEDKLGPLAQRTRWYTADVWNPASLRGRARGHASVIHTIGSMVADPTQGLNHNWLNFVSARNVANMCVSDGVPHMVLMSTVRAPWVNGNYLRAKREAEGYMERVGIHPTIIRAPVAYVRGTPRHPFYILMTILGSTPILSWFWFGRAAPMPADMLARGVARITLDKNRGKTIFYASDLRKRNTAREARRAAPLTPRESQNPQKQVHPFELLDEDTPFGWIPPEKRDKE
ncbi:MAG: SDR family oxidoreductase [Chloroflexota bacterium]